MCPSCKTVPLSGSLDAFPVNFSLLTLVLQEADKVKLERSSTDFDNILSAINDITDIMPAASNLQTFKSSTSLPLTPPFTELRHEELGVNEFCESVCDKHG